MVVVPPAHSASMCFACGSSVWINVDLPAPNAPKTTILYFSSAIVVRWAKEAVYRFGRKYLIEMCLLQVFSIVLRIFLPVNLRFVLADHHLPFFRMNVPFLYSANARCSSSSVFITIGPPQATGSRRGFPEKYKNRVPIFPAF